MATVHQFRVFLAAYELGSLTAAAARLGYAQPSVSEQVRLLERSLGARLFERVGFTREAHLRGECRDHHGVLRDTFVYSMLAREWASQRQS